MSRQEPSRNSSSRPSDPLDRKRPVSERKIQANRENSHQSTGPKTERGKRTVSRNAIKHGFLAREVVITAGDGEESQEEFHALLESLSVFYEPIGIVEEALAQTIGATFWRKARVIRAGNGEIRGQLDTLSRDRAQLNLDKGNLEVVLLHAELRLYNPENSADQRVPTRDRYFAMQAAQSNLRDNRPGRTYLATLLTLAKSEIQSDDYLSEQVRKKIVSAFSFWDYTFALICDQAVPPPAGTEDQRSDKGVDQRDETKRAVVIAFIDDRLEKLESFEKYALEREKLAVEAEGRMFSLPSAEATDRLLRYDAPLGPAAVSRHGPTGAPAAAAQRRKCAAASQH
jgi:hypothetical protein